MAKIAIDAGHHLYTSGRRCLKSIDPAETREWVLNNRVAVELARLLESAGHEVFRVDDITGKTDVLLETRVKRANDLDVDFYISVHHNGGINGGKGGGIEIYVVKQQPSMTSIKAQNAIYNNALKRTGLKGNRANPINSANFYVIKYTKMPACLIECGYMDSVTDIPFIIDPEWSKKMALGIAEGICEIFGGTIKVDSPKKETSKKTTEKKDKIKEKPEELKLDGEWGKLTTKSSQYVLKTGSDGIISSQPIGVKKYLLTAKTSTWEFVEKDYEGSALIKAIQELTGVPEDEIDGLFGKNSVKYMQRFLKKNGYYTGLISGKLNKATTIGWQKYINKRMGY